MKKKIVKLSPILVDTFQFIKQFKRQNKTGPLVSEVGFHFDLSYSAASGRVKKLIKMKKVVRNTKTGYITVK